MAFCEVGKALGVAGMFQQGNAAVNDVVSLYCAFHAHFDLRLLRCYQRDSAVRTRAVFVVVAQPGQVSDEVGMVLRGNKIPDVLTNQLGALYLQQIGQGQIGFHDLFFRVMGKQSQWRSVEQCFEALAEAAG